MLVSGRKHLPTCDEPQRIEPARFMVHCRNGRPALVSLHPGAALQGLTQKKEAAARDTRQDASEEEAAGNVFANVGNTCEGLFCRHPEEWKVSNSSKNRLARPRQILHCVPKGRGQRTGQRCKPTECPNGRTMRVSASRNCRGSLEPHQTISSRFRIPTPPDALCRLVGGPTLDRWSPSCVLFDLLPVSWHIWSGGSTLPTS